MSRRDVEAIEALVRTLHSNSSGIETDCDAQDDDAIEDHDTELAMAGEIIMALRRRGLIVAKARARRQVRP